MSHIKKKSLKKEKSLLQGIFLTLESNPHLLHWQADSLSLSHQRGPELGIEISDLLVWFIFVTHISI